MTSAPFNSAFGTAHGILETIKRQISTVRYAFVRNCDILGQIIAFHQYTASFCKNFGLAVYHDKRGKNLRKTVHYLEKLIGNIMDIAELDIMPQTFTLPLVIKALEIKIICDLAKKKMADRA